MVPFLPTPANERKNPLCQMQTPGGLSKDLYEYSSSLAPSTPGLALLSLLGPPPCPLTGADSKVQVSSSKRCPHITTVSLVGG